MKEEFDDEDEEDDKKETEAPLRLIQTGEHTTSDIRASVHKAQATNAANPSFAAAAGGRRIVENPL